MEKVAYILGAGFSQPLGLPLMRNFIIKAKDLYFKDTKKYEYFPRIFDALNDLARCKNYFHSNQTNIEEVLSILEMSDHLGSRRIRSLFIKFIKDTIEGYTPDFSTLEFSRFAGFEVQPFHGGRHPWSSTYGKFIYALLGGNLTRTIKKDFGNELSTFSFSQAEDRETRYAVVSLNYDLIFESFAKVLTRSCHPAPGSLIKCEFKTPDASWDLLRVAKLHGSVDTGSIIPPTWSKTVPHRIKQSWQVALQILKSATQIRFIGYSLPSSDSYLKYLFKCAALNADHLKSIDVICYDPKGDAEKRYNDFVEYDYFRFRNLKTEDYLQDIARLRNQKNLNLAEFYIEENYHDQIMNGERLNGTSMNG